MGHTLVLTARLNIVSVHCERINPFIGTDCQLDCLQINATAWVLWVITEHSKQEGWIYLLKCLWYLSINHQEKEEKKKINTHTKSAKIFHSFNSKKVFVYKEQRAVKVWKLPKLKKGKEAAQRLHTWKPKIGATCTRLVCHTSHLRWPSSHGIS